MSGFKVSALYDFTGEPGTGELSIKAGDILTVTRSDVGEGWWEGTNAAGKSGLFPAAYVETISTSGPPDRPPPMLPPQASVDNDNNWGGDNNTGNDADGWDDDWDEDTYSEIGPGGNSQQIYANDNVGGSAPTMPLPAVPYDDNISNYGGSDSRGPVAKKNLNRFSNFVKSGIESYIFGDLKIQVSDADKIYISLSDHGICSWPSITRPYTVQVASPKKESKLKGLKSFIAYQLTPSFNSIQVSRRYKHFDWLHERLTEKFCIIPIPPLPDKQISNRYDEHFIEHRRVQLQAFVDWVCQHPVLSVCEVWQHFLTCTDEKRWKLGKRQAEKDNLVGANFCVLLETPEKLLMPSVLDPQIERCQNFIHSLDNSLKNLMATVVEQTKKHQGPYKREFQKVGESFYAFGTSLDFGEDSAAIPSKLTDAVKRTGATYIEISKLVEDQPKYDWEPLNDRLHLYKGITQGFPDVLAVHKVAMNKRRECEKLTSDQKMNVSELTEVTRKTDVINYGILAEINHFKKEREIDIRITMKAFLQQQIQFYENVVHKLQNTLDLFDEQ